MTRDDPEGTLLLLCSPGLGILDSWLPVLTEVRAQAPQARIMAMIPKRDRVWDIVPDDTLIRLADELIDAVFVPYPRDGGYYTASQLAGASTAVRLNWLLSRFESRLRCRAVQTRRPRRYRWGMRTTTRARDLLRKRIVRGLVDLVALCVRLR